MAMGQKDKPQEPGVFGLFTIFPFSNRFFGVLVYFCICFFLFFLLAIGFLGYPLPIAK